MRAALLALLLLATASGAAPFTIGQTALLPSGDSGNGDLLLAQHATLPQNASAISCSFYVTQAAGDLRLGIYDGTGPGGGPGNLVAQTAQFPAATGWNTAAIPGAPMLSAGDYWLAYFPSSSALAFLKDEPLGLGAYWYPLTFGQMPATFSSAPNNTTSQWSFYCTMNDLATAVDGVPGAPVIQLRQIAAVTLAWDAPLLDEQGAPVTTLAGYRLYIGPGSSGCPGGPSTYVAAQSPTPQPGDGGVETKNLPIGVTQIAQVTSVDTGGAESACSTSLSVTPQP